MMTMMMINDDEDNTGLTADIDPNYDRHANALIYERKAGSRVVMKPIFYPDCKLHRHLRWQNVGHINTKIDNYLRCQRQSKWYSTI